MVLKTYAGGYVVKMTTQETFTVPVYTFDRTLQNVKILEFASLTIPRNVTDVDLFIYALIDIQFKAIETDIRLQRSKVLGDIECSYYPVELDRLYMSANQIENAYKNVCEARTSLLGGGEVVTENTIAEIVSYVMFPSCRGTKRKPRIPTKTMELFNLAVQTNHTYSVQKLREFSAAVNEYIGFHTSEDGKCGYARNFRCRIKELTLRGILNSCSINQYKYEHNKIVMLNPDIRDFIMTVFCGALVDTYKIPAK